MRKLMSVVLTVKPDGEVDPYGGPAIKGRILPDDGASAGPGLVRTWSLAKASSSSDLPLAAKGTSADLPMLALDAGLEDYRLEPGQSGCFLVGPARAEYVQAGQVVRFIDGTMAQIGNVGAEMTARPGPLRDSGVVTLTGGPDSRTDEAPAGNATVPASPVASISDAPYTPADHSIKVAYAGTWVRANPQDMPKANAPAPAQKEEDEPDLVEADWDSPLFDADQLIFG